MRIVQLDRHFVGKAIKVFVGRQVTANDVLQRRGNEEVLLFEPQFLAFERVVVGIQDFGNDLGSLFVLHGPRNRRG